MDRLDDFSQIWLTDFEYRQPDGEPPAPHVLVAKEFKTGRVVRRFGDDLRQPFPPYSTGPDTLFVAYTASAEFNCHRALGWPLPVYALDLFLEYLCVTNYAAERSSDYRPYGRGLVGALIHFGLPTIGVEEKDEMRQLAMRGEPYTAEEWTALQDYCLGDVTALERLLPAMFPDGRLPLGALFRGRYMQAVSAMETNGIPIDVDAYEQLDRHWEPMLDRLVASADLENLFEGRRFRHAAFERWVEARGLDWPRTTTGLLCTDNDTFSDFAAIHPDVRPMYEVQKTLRQLRMRDLPVSSDGRARCMLGAFGSRTGRNQPRSKAFVFSRAKWQRSLIKPPPGRGIAYLDYVQQEFAVAAALSDDGAMKDAYTSGNPYLALAQQVGAVPSGATKETHPRERSLFKTCVLGVQYSMGRTSLGQRIQRDAAWGRYFIDQHRQAFPVFWTWIESAVAYAMAVNTLRTVWGWEVHIGPGARPAGLFNWPMQSNASDMLQMACILAEERGVQLLAPIHDALLIEAPLDELKHQVAVAQKAMEDASEAVLDGFRIRTDAQCVHYPDRFIDEDGMAMWKKVWGILEQLVEEPLAVVV